MKKLSLEQMESTSGGDWACGFATASMCVGALALASAGPFAALAFAPAAGCVAGIAGGCA